MEEPKVLTADRPDAPPRKKRKTFLRIGAEWILRELMRLRLAVWLLMVMTVTMIVGSIFPQGYGAETYIESWGEGRYAVLSRLGLLDLFDTKFFLVLGIILLLNLVVCSVVRLSSKRSVSVSKSAAPAGGRSIDMGSDTDSAMTRAVRALTERGYYVSRATKGAVTARRGPWPEGVSLLYHLAMAVAIIGFLASALHAFEGDVTLYPGEPVAVRTTSSDTGWQRFRHTVAAWNIISWHPFESALPDTSVGQGRDVTLTLNEFITEWELYQDKYYPRDWVSDVTVNVVGHGPEVIWPSRRVEVNRPLRAGGLTFYQMAYEQEFDVVVWDGDEEVERVRANAYVPFTLESVAGMFFPGTLRVGTLYQKYMPTEPVVPHVSLKWQPPEEAAEEMAADAAAVAADKEAAEPEVAEPEETELTETEPDTAAADTALVAVAEPEAPAGPPERVELGDLSAAGEPIELRGLTLTLENPYEGSVLTYRHDPGVATLYIAITLFMFGLAIRTYWPSYRVNLWIEGTEAGALGKLLFRATGMLGEPKVVEDDLVAALGGDRGAPSPTPFSSDPQGTPPDRGPPVEVPRDPYASPSEDAPSPDMPPPGSDDSEPVL